MRFLVDKWRRIGARLYLALGFAVFLTLVSGAVGVYYFERSGDLNYQVGSESMPALEASWAAAREAERLKALGLELLTEGGADGEDAGARSVGDSLKGLEGALGIAGGVDALTSDAQSVQEAAYDLVGVIDNLAVNRTALMEANATADDLRARIDSIRPAEGPDREALSALRQAMLADDETTLQSLWDDFTVLHAAGIAPAIASLGEGQGVFTARRQQLALLSRNTELSASFNDAGTALDDSVSALLSSANAQATDTLGAAVSRFDQGRVLLTAISVISVLSATLAAWLWVGNGMVRRLSRMSERMRDMADGDLETPVPEVGRDEIGELAEALEVFRQQALEVQRLNLVEKLYGELREANEELVRMQARLVAQEKLAALGELVSGVAHEISNPLNFVQNFSEGTLELYDELTEMLETYKNAMSEEDADLLEEIGQEISDSLNRVIVSGGRALAIVERMRGMGVEGSESEPIDLNSMLPQIIQVGCEAFEAQYPRFSVKRAIDLDSSVGDVQLVEHDFGEAMVNLVSNACYAMMLKGEDAGEGYEPVLTVTSRLRDGQVEVGVRDNGTGIADDVLGHIFNPFFSTREGALGAGLGLSIAADVARRLGGDLSVDTVHGEYAEFTMILPAADSTAVAVEATAEVS